MSWDKELSPEEREQWNAFVDHVREKTVRAMTESAFVASLVPDGKPDIKFAVELGLAIMLDKPIIAIAMPGCKPPPGLRKVAHGIVYADLDTEAGQQHAAAQLKKLMAQLPRH